MQNMNHQDPKVLGYANAIIVMLEAGIDDSASYREPINGVFCHLYGHVTKNNQRALDRYKKSAPLSKAAAQAPELPRVFEHIVPMAVIFQELQKLQTKDGRANTPKDSDLSNSSDISNATDISNSRERLNAAGVIELIAKLYQVRQVTKAEDDKLRAAGLRYQMPEGYYQPHHPLYLDVEARHKWVGIDAAECSPALNEKAALS